MQHLMDSVFFYTSKIIWTLIRPDAWIVFAVLIALWALWCRRQRLLQWVLTGLGLFVTLIALFPLGAWLLAPLEDSYPPQTAPEHVDGLIILGGFEDFAAQELSRQFAVGPAADRIFEGLALARRFPQAQVVLSGGSGDPRRPDYAGADVAYAHAIALGFAKDRFVIEETSRNTYENAVNTLAMVQIAEGDTWLLVTSAFHMRRAMGIFCAQGVRLVPYPVDYISGDRGRWPTFALAKNLSLLSISFHTLLGEAVYRWTGRSTDCKAQVIE